MLPTAVEIKDKLLKALDDKNDIDDATVLEMVSILERYPITRATLEETKIGKMVNDLRRKIKNEKLAKRVKQLVRNWKKLLDETAPVNGTAGPRHPAIAQLQASPAVSPVLTRVQSAGRLNSPASVAGKPSTPKLSAHKTVSPGLAGRSGVVGGRQGATAHKTVSPGLTGRSSVAGGRQGASPGLAVNQPPIPFSVHKVSSPALTGARLKTSSSSPSFLGLASSGRMASPAVSGRKVSPAVSPSVSGRVAASSSRVSSPLVSSGVVSPAVSRRVASPALTTPAKRETGPASSLAPDSPGLSLSGRRDQQTTPSMGRQQAKGKGVGVGETSNGGSGVILTSGPSDNSQDRVLGDMGRGRLDSDDESSCGSSRTGQSHNPPQHNHSSTPSLTDSNSKHYITDQREVSKTNVANRKRARELSSSPPDNMPKKSRLESPGLSLHDHRHDKAINGYASKSKKKHLAGCDAPAMSSVSSLPSVQTHVCSPQLSKPYSENSNPFPSTDNFLHQDSESRLSGQLLDRPARDKHKVKTTEQLIEALQKKNKSSKVGNNIMSKLRTNQIEKESDLPGSVLPAGVKPRGKRGRPKKNDVCVSVPSSDEMLQVKNELVERFLNSSDPASPVDDYSPFTDDLLPDPGQSALDAKLEMGACSSSYSKDNFDTFSASRQDRSESAPKDERSMSPPLPLASLAERTGSALSLREIYAQLPPVDHDIDWEAEDFFELPEPTPVTEEAVESMHKDHLPGINGIYDIHGDWSAWQDTITLPSYQGDQLHILPYVDLDN